MLSVSAVIPAHNRERYIGDALESVLRQDRPVDEIIVVDDGSTDDTARITASFSNVQLVRLANRAALQERGTLAFAAARGDVLAWLDSDDVWFHDHTRTTVALLERHPTAVARSRMPSTSAIVTDYGRGPTFRTRSRSMRCRPRSGGRSRRCHLPSLDGPRSAHRRVRRIAAVVCGLRSVLETLDLGPFVSTSRVTRRYRWHGDQISSRPPNSWNRCMCRVTAVAIARRGRPAIRAGTGRSCVGAGMTTCGWPAQSTIRDARVLTRLSGRCLRSVRWPSLSAARV